MENELTVAEWEQFSDFLIRIAGMSRSTWTEKREVCKENLSKSGLAAMCEVAAWEWEWTP
jgi:hypothetical protein